jgi:hypothetical protein
MALTEADIEQFIEALHNSAELRERARAVILSDDFLELPRIVARLAERIDMLGLEISKLTDGMKSLDGRVGRLEGWRFETRYRENLASHLVRRFRRPKLLIAGNVPALIDGLDRNEFNPEEWTQIIALDVLARATDVSRPEHADIYLAIELSIVVDESDVERARERADILARALDLPVVPCVDGEAILRDAELRAAQLGVVNLRG